MSPTLSEIHARTAKPRDILWNRFVARPLATPLVALLANTRVTPNQITLLGLVVFAGACAWLAMTHGQASLIGAALALQLAYVLDCVDGQLARWRQTSTPVGAHLDFLTDELKAFLLVAASAVRLHGETRRDAWLLEGLLGLAAVAAALALTAFVRRPEYVAATGAAPPSAAGDYGQGFAATVQAAAVAPTVAATALSPAPASDAPAPAAPSLLAHPIRAVEAVGRFVIHYPSYIVFVALADRLDLFLHAYIAVNAAHAARTLLQVTGRLGRFGA